MMMMIRISNIVVAMKIFSTLILVNAAAARSTITSDGDKPSSMQLMERHLAEVDPAALGEAFSMDADFSCLMGGAESSDDCEYPGCVWCPLGHIIGGACLSLEQGDVVNSMQFPHLMCGQNVLEGSIEEDAAFWDNQVTCEMASTTEVNCLAAGIGCTWCVVDDPQFGLCMSADFMTELENLEPEDEEIKLKDVVQCSKESRNTNVEGLLDFSCFIASQFGRQLCEQTYDMAARQCQFISLNGFGDFCLSPTQLSLVEWFNDLMQDMDIDWQSMIFGEEEIGDGNEANEVEKEGFDGDEEDDVSDKEQDELNEKSDEEQDEFSAADESENYKRVEAVEITEVEEDQDGEN